jgi:hypothetical protein
MASGETPSVADFIGDFGEIFIINGNSLVESNNGQLVKLDIKIPRGLKYLVNSMDHKIIAYCEVHNNYSIYELYELINREFVLKHTFNRFMLGIPGYPINLKRCQYVKNILLLQKVIDGLIAYEIIDLEINDIILICYGISAYYCDGIITIPPISIDYCKKYYNIDPIDKTITNL